MAQAFAKGKRDRTDNGPAAGEDLLREAEDENLGQDGGVNLEVGGGIWIQMQILVSRSTTGTFRTITTLVKSMRT